MQMDTLQKDMIAAMKARDKGRKDAISALISAVKKVAIDEGCREDIKEELVDRVILKELKTVKEQIDSCPADRTDLLEEYQLRYDVMNEYAPQLLSAEEVEAILKEKFADVLALGNKGQVMKAVMPELKGKADGKVINQVVTKLCQ
ncbi:MAG: GatB/YqeY domain-containing protein [Lachnospiraceae bacterium]|nr:GatB/YqeY domain-containing protein [Lachnospiraceae bacterium]